jgi:hypothetical protein
MALSKIDTTNMIEDVPQSKLDNNINFRNIIINGDMSIAQRATSATGITGNGYNTIDRMLTGMATAGTWTQSQDTDVPSGQGFAKSLKMDCTTANASLSAGSAILLHHRIEGQNVQYLKYGTSSAESLTLSFWVKSNKTGTYIAELDQNGNSRDYSQSYTINSANTWEKKILTFDGDTSATLANDNTQQLEVNFWLAAGTDYASGTLNNAWSSTVNANRAVGQVNLADSTSNEWYITGVQLEAGTTASDFEFLPHDINLKRCERYYQVIAPNNGSSFNSFANGQYYQSNSIRTSYKYRTELRANGSLGHSTGTNYFSVERNGANDYFSAIQTAYSRPFSILIYRANAEISGTAGHSCTFYAHANTGGYVFVDAEL